MYRARVISSEAAANGDIHLDVYVESDRTEEWVLIPGGHRTLVLDGAAVLAITEGSGTVTQKRAALSALFKQEVKSWGIDESDEANEQMLDLVTLPINVNL